MCALNSSRLDDFSDIVTYTVMIAIFFEGKLEILGGKASTPQIPKTEPC